MEISAQLLKRRIAAGLPPPAPSRAGGNPAPSSEQVRRKAIDLADLVAVAGDEQFLKQAYRRILDRECDITGFVNYLELLRRHVPRRAILSKLVDSEEARKRGVAFTGVPGGRAGIKESGFPLFATPARRLAALGRELIRRVLFARFDSIDHKLTFLLREVASRTDVIASKSDSALWTLSEKLDSYIAQVLQKQSQIEESLSGYAKQLDEIGALKQLHAQSLETLEQIGDRCVGVLVELQTEILKTAAGADAQLAQLISDQQTSAVEIASLGSELSNLKRSTFESLAQISGKLRPPIISAGADVLVTELDGLIIGVPGREWRMAAYHAFRGPMEPGLAKLFRRLVKPGSAVIDVGANIGYFTLLAAKLLEGSGKVYSFEPTPQTFKLLKDNIQVNGLFETDLIELRQAAVTDRAGRAMLSTFSGDCGHNTLFRDDQADGEVEVTTVSLDEILPSDAKIDLIKVDSEGSELLVFRGMKNLIAHNPRVHIVLEFAPVHLRRAGQDPESALAELRDSGFEIRRVDDVTGDVEEVSPERLCGTGSSNVFLVRK